MDKQFMPNESPEKRSEYLQSTAAKVVKESYFVRLSTEELSNARTEFTANRLKIDDLLEQKKDVLAEFKENLKPLEDIHKELSTQVRQGYKEKEGKLYGFIEGNMVYFYDGKGELIELKTRPATADELDNPTIHMEIKRTGTNS